MTQRGPGASHTWATHGTAPSALLRANPIANFMSWVQGIPARKPWPAGNAVAQASRGGTWVQWLRGGGGQALDWEGGKTLMGQETQVEKHGSRRYLPGRQSLGFWGMPEAEPRARRGGP